MIAVGGFAYTSLASSGGVTALLTANLILFACFSLAARLCLVNDARWSYHIYWLDLMPYRARRRTA